MKRHILLLAVFTFSTTATAFAQNTSSKSLQDFVDKKMKKNGIQATTTHRLKAKEYAAPKKIGILVFVVAGSKEFTGNDGWYDHFRTISKDAATLISQSIHDACIGTLKENYAAQGVQLLTPNEYLDTDAKRLAYQNMNMRIMGAAKLSEAWVKPDQVGLPAGYKFFTNTFHNDIGGRADIADELKMFGMDGYLSIVIQFYGPKTVSQISTNLMLLKERDYVSRIKKETYRRSDVSQHMLPLSYTQILASERDKLKAKHGKEDQRDSMIDFDNGKVWVDPNIAKVIVYSANLYFPMVK